MDDVLLLSRIQFALTVTFHYIYPPFSIGLGVMLVLMEGSYLKTGKEIYRKMAKFWTKIFALIFSIGVATGIVMEFEFGTNWATYSRYVGDVFGSPLAAEGVFAFFLESSFLAILLFGWGKVGKKLHFFSTLMVCLGAHFSAVWIVVANSWMQTPSGFEIVGEGLGARAEITDFWAMVFNPSSVVRLAHVILGAWQAGAWLVISISAYYLLKKRHLDFARKSLRIALSFAILAALVQLYTGHSSADVVAANQPEKLAAMEGHFETGKAPLYLIGNVDEESKKTSGIAIPGGLSFLLHGDFEAPVTGLNDLEDTPPANVVFQTYHIMIAVGMALIALSVLAGFLFWKGKLEKSRWLLWIMVFGVLLPQIANQAGWYCAEIGRQPWIVYKLLKTSDALSNTVKANMVLSSIVLFTIVYIVLFVAFILLLHHKIQKGPDGLMEKDDVVEA